MIQDELQGVQRPYDAVYTPGIGWQAVTPTGRYGSYETEDAALRAARTLTSQSTKKEPT